MPDEFLHVVKIPHLEQVGGVSCGLTRDGIKESTGRFLDAAIGIHAPVKFDFCEFLSG